MHRKVLCLAALLLGALAALPGNVAGQAKKNQQNQAQSATDQDYYLIKNQKAVTATLIAFDDASHTATVRIDFPEWLPNPKYRPNVGAQRNLMRDYQQLMQQQVQVMRSRNARQIQQHMVRMAQLQNQIQMDMARANSFNPNNPPFIKKDHLKDFDLEIEEKVVYRKKFLPEEYDDTGNLKKPTAEELKKLRGNNKPQGTYIATASEFHPGQGVWVYLTAPKKAGSSSSSSSSSSTASKDKDGEEKDSDLKDTTVPRPTVNMLVVYQDGTLTTNSQNNNRKKKKN